MLLSNYADSCFFSFSTCHAPLCRATFTFLFVLKAIRQSTMSVGPPASLLSRPPNWLAVTKSSTECKPVLTWLQNRRLGTHARHARTVGLNGNRSFLVDGSGSHIKLLLLSAVQDDSLISDDLMKSQQSLRECGSVWDRNACAHKHARF